MERKQTLPEYLKQLRKACHYKQKDIALQLHISRQTYSHYETGRIRPSVNILYKIAKLYGISADDILEHMEISLLEQEEEEKPGYHEGTGNISEKELLSGLRHLDEKSRMETLSIMWEIMQAKIMKQEREKAGK